MDRTPRSAPTPGNRSGDTAGRGLLGHGGQASLTLASGDTTALKPLRRWLGLLLGDAASVDVQLALSELATNAIQHGIGGEIRINVTRGDELVVRVANRADRVPAVQEQSVPQPRGRGLAIVAATVSDMEIDFRDGEAVVTCWFPGEPRRS